MGARRIESTALLGGALFVGATGLYLATLSRQYSGDSCLYAAVAEGARPIRVVPHHLPLDPLARLWFRFWTLWGWDGGAMLPLQVLNALAGAACVLLVARLARRFVARTFDAALAAAGFAVCGAMWLLSTEAEFVTVPLALELLVLNVILTRGAASTAHPLQALGIGAMIGGAAVTYMSAAALLPTAMAGLRGDAKGRWRAAVLLLIGAAGPLGAAAAVTTWWFGGAGALRAVLRPGQQYGVVDCDNVPRGVYAFLRTLVLFPGLGMNDRTSLWRQQASAAQQAAFVLTYAVAAVAAAIPLRRVIGERLRPDVSVLMVWTALHVAFALYWVPSDMSFWVQATTVWWVAAGAYSATGPRARAAVCACVLALLAMNGLGLIRSHHRTPPLGAPHPCAFVAS